MTDPDRTPAGGSSTGDDPRSDAAAGQRPSSAAEAVPSSGINLRGAIRSPRMSVGNRTTLILAVVAALLAGAGGAGAATLLGGGPTIRWSGGPGSLPTEASAEPASSAPATGAISLSATGDVIMGMAPRIVAPNNGKGMFDKVRDMLTADLQMANLEQVISEETGHSKCAAGSTRCFAFRTAPATVNNLKDAGFHLVNLANNHAYDYGPTGYKNTQNALDGVGITYTGFPEQVTVAEVKGIKVAVVGFASYQEWSNLCSDLGAAEKVVNTAAGQADLVVVQVHMGAEGSGMTRVRPGTEMFLGENRCDPIKFSHTVVDAGADLVVGHGPHVVRGMEFYKGRLIAYSLGNFMAYGGALQTEGVLGVTAIIRVTLNRDGTWAGGTLIPARIVSPGVPSADPKKEAVTLIGSLSKQDFPQTGAKIAADGAITAP
jgi:Bacterial capsule synthesis protein PGA_cap